MTRMATVKTVLALQEEPRTMAQLQEITGCTYDGVRVALREMRQAGFVEAMGWGKTTERGGVPVLWGWRK